MKWRSLWVVLLVLMSWLWPGTADAGLLSDRLAQFPNWPSKPLVQSAKGDLIYPDWFAGTWSVTTTLIDLAAPLAPEITTPGFEGNRQYLDQPLQFEARFMERGLGQWELLSTLPLPIPKRKSPIIADRAFNGLNLANAYLAQVDPTGESPVMLVKVDPSNPNRQITFLTGDRQLISTITGRATESTDDERFVTTEVMQQEFRGASQLYFNAVESTTAYAYHPDSQPPITADQVTAIYLSPQDPDFFKASDRPVALYRYRLEFYPVSQSELGQD